MVNKVKNDKSQPPLPRKKKDQAHKRQSPSPQTTFLQKQDSDLCDPWTKCPPATRARSLVAFYTHLSARECLLFICVFICLFSERHCSYCQHAVWSVVIIVHPVVTVSPRCTQVLSSSLHPLQMNQVQRAPGGKKRSQVTVWLAFFFLQSRLIKATVLAC